jgi:hypothetical protein
MTVKGYHLRFGDIYEEGNFADVELDVIQGVGDDGINLEAPGLGRVVVEFAHGKLHVFAWTARGNMEGDDPILDFIVEPEAT